MNTNSKLTANDSAKQATISNFEEFRQYIRENSIGDRALSIRGLAGLCGVDRKAIMGSGEFVSAKLAQKLAEFGYQGGELLEKGFDSNASWAVVEYYAFESKAKAPGAKKLARLFGSLGVAKAFEIAEESKAEKVARKSLDDLSRIQLWALFLYKEVETKSFSPDIKVLEGIDPIFWGAHVEVLRYAFARKRLAELERVQPAHDLYHEVFGDPKTLVKDMRQEFDELQDLRRYVGAGESLGMAKALEDFELAINGALAA
jgi:hypothetical protein